MNKRSLRRLSAVVFAAGGVLFLTNRAPEPLARAAAVSPSEHRGGLLRSGAGADEPVQRASAPAPHHEPVSVGRDRTGNRVPPVLTGAGVEESGGAGQAAALEPTASAASASPSPNQLVDRLLRRLSGGSREVITVDPGGAGDFLTVDGQFIQVESYEPLPAAAAPALHIAIVPQPIPDEVTAEPDSTGGQLAAAAGPGPSPIGEDNGSILKHTKKVGFTLAEENFRTKWGWAAYDAVRRAAQAP